MALNDELKLFEDRASASVDCETSLPAQQGDVDPAAPVIPCETPAPLDPNTFYQPPGVAPATPPARKLPAPITIRNRAVEHSCPSGTQPPGDFAPSLDAGISYDAETGTLTIGEGYLELPVFLDAVVTEAGDQSLKLTDLYRLSNHTDEIATYVDANLFAYYPTDQVGFAAGLEPILQVSEAAAADVARTIFDTLTILEASALLQAQGLLPCVFKNEEFWVTCNPSSSVGYTVTPTDPGSGVREHVLAGSFESTTSVTDANNKALIAALPALGCVVGNAEVTVTCAALSSNFDVSFAYPNEDSAPVTLESLDGTTFQTLGAGVAGSPPTLRTLTYTVTREDNTFFAATRETANALARADALAALECFVPSPVVSRSCATQNASAAERLAAMTEAHAWAEDDLLNEMATGYHDVSRATLKPDNQGISGGLIVMSTALKATSPAGFFTADTADNAKALAEYHALSLLECAWTSPQHSCGCVGPNTGLPDGQSYQFTQSQIAAEPNAYLNYTASVTSNTLEAGQFVTSTFPGSTLTVAQAWSSTLSSICIASLTCVFESCAIVCCAPQPDDRPRMENGEVNRFWLPGTGRTTNLTAKTAWLSGRSLPVGCSGRPPGCPPGDPAPPGCANFNASGCPTGSGTLAESSLLGTWSGVPATGTPARFRFGGTLQPGYVWRDPEEFTDNDDPLSLSTLGCNIAVKTQAGDPTQDHYSCVLGQATAIGTFFNLYEQAKADATSRLQCDHIAWGRHLIKCEGSNQRSLRTVNINQRFIAPSTKLANMQHERTLMSLMACEEMHPFKLSVVEGKLHVSKPTVNILGGGGGGLTCDTEGAERGLRPMKLYQDCDHEWPIDSAGYYAGITSASHVFIKAQCCGGVVRWILHIEASSDSYDYLNASFGTMSEDAKTKQTGLESADSIVWYVGSVAKKSAPSGDTGDDEWIAHQNLNAPISYGAGGGAIVCPFGATYSSGTDTKLQGGVVSGGSGAPVVIADTVIRGSTEPTDGWQVWLEIDFTANQSGGILLPGGSLSGTGTVNKGATIPSVTLPTASSAGKVVVPLGDFSGGTFRPAGCGNINVSFCPGSLTYSRV